MVQVLGNASRAGVGGEGLEVPLNPRPVSPAQAAVRSERLAALVETGEARAPQPRRARPRTGEHEPFPVPAAARRQVAMSAVPGAPVPAARAVLAGAAAVPPPPMVPDLTDVIEELAPAGPVACRAPGCTQLVTAEFVRRTGQRIHPPCRDRLAVQAS